MPEYEYRYLFLFFQRSKEVHHSLASCTPFIQFFYILGVTLVHHHNNSCTSFYLL